MKSVVITGGQGSFGQALQRRFHGPGWSVSAPGKRELDVTDPEAVAGYFSTRHVDLLVCAAGVVGDGPLLRQSEIERDGIFSVNLDGAVLCARAVLPGMVKRKSGHIVFISSHSAIHPPSGQTAYASAKAGLLGLAASLARKYGVQGIRVNTILPGFMETTMTHGISDKRKEEIRQYHVLERFNTPDAAAGFIRYLEEHLPHTSGQIFQLDSRPQGF